MANRHPQTAPGHIDAGSGPRRRALPLLLGAALFLSGTCLAPGLSAAETDGRFYLVAQNDDGDEIMDFFLEGVEGLAPPSSSSTPPAGSSAPPLPPETSAAPAPAASADPKAASPASAPPPVLNIEPRPSAEKVAPVPKTPAAPEAAGSDVWTPLPAAPASSQASPPTTGTIFGSSGAAPSLESHNDPADPFRPLPSSEPDSARRLQEPLSLEPAAPEAVTLGGGVAAPPPETEPIRAADDSSVNWIQLEIGQSDIAAPAPPARTPAAGGGARPTSVYSLSPADRPAGPSQAPIAENPPAASVAPTVEAAMDQAIQQPAEAAKPFEPEERQRLRDLFPDMMTQSAAQADAPVDSRASGGAAGSGSIQRPLSLPAESPARPAQSPAIFKAGELLAEDYAGSAEILSPGSPQPAPAVKKDPPKEKPKAAPAPERAKTVEPKEPAPKAAAKPKAAPAARPKAKAAPKKTAKSRAKSAPAKAAAPASAGLIIINETGQSRVGEQYGSVLRKMGFKVSSVANAQKHAGSGQTVITYRPGLKSQAQAVARHLPGQKILVEAPKGQVLASEVMIHLR